MRYANNKWTKQPFPPPAALAGGGLALFILVVAWLLLTETPVRIRQPVQAVAKTVAAAPAIAQSSPPRLVYRNSVIPGGVHSAAELASSLHNDAVASAHYAGFDVAAAHVVRVAQSRLVHVSYRVGDKIFWTKNKVRLAAGEELLSDGTHLVRARCGNRIADEPEGPVQGDEPAPEVLDALMVSAEDLIDQPVPQMVNMAAVDAAVFQAPPVAASTVAQPVDMRLASTMQGVTPLPVIGFLHSSSPRVLALVPLPLSSDAPAIAPSEADVADVDVLGSVVVATPATDSPAPFTPPPAVGPQPLAPAAAPPTPMPTPLPEPGSAALAAMSLGVLALVRRRRQRRRAGPAQAS